jgi:glycosyltransferase involved in cell wall biosynthesis
MILGMPVVSTNVGGITSLITDKEEGLLVQEGEPYSMAGAIIELVNDYDFARLLGKNARKRSLMRHNPGVIGERLIEIYKTILSLNGK